MKKLLLLIVIALGIWIRGFVIDLIVIILEAIESIGEKVPWRGNFRLILGNEALLPRITGKTTLWWI